MCFARSKIWKEQSKSSKYYICTAHRKSSKMRSSADHISWTRRKNWFEVGRGFRWKFAGTRLSLPRSLRSPLAPLSRQYPAQHVLLKIGSAPGPIRAVPRRGSKLTNWANQVWMYRQSWQTAIYIIFAFPAHYVFREYNSSSAANGNNNYNPGFV